jgi:hypothetical protein
MSRATNGVIPVALLAALAVCGSGLSAAEDRTQPAQAPAPPQASLAAAGAAAIPREAPALDRRSLPEGREALGSPSRRESPSIGGGRQTVQSVIAPPPTSRLTQEPTPVKWRTRNRDLTRCLMAMARRGLVPATRVPDDLPLVTGVSFRPAGWIAYAFAVPARGTLRVKLEHPKEAWFHLRMVDRWGHLTKGMLQNVIPTGRPRVSFVNPFDEGQVVYVIVDDPGWMSWPDSPFLLRIDRDWELGKVGPNDAKPALGIWANIEPILRIEKATPESAPAAPDDPKGSTGSTP